MTITPEHIAAAWALVNAATKGPWFAESGHEQGNGQLYWQVTDATDAIMQNQFCWCQGDHAANAAFIAASRELVPQLLTALEAEQAKVARLVSEMLCVVDYVDDASRGLLLYRGKSDLSKMAGEDLVRIQILLAEIKETDHE